MTIYKGLDSIVVNTIYNIEYIYLIYNSTHTLYKYKKDTRISVEKVTT